MVAVPNCVWPVMCCVVLRLGGVVGHWVPYPTDLAIWCSPFDGAALQKGGNGEAV